jgi:ATP-dependent DNA ligase
MIAASGQPPSCPGAAFFPCTRCGPELVAEVKYLTWTDDNLLRQVAYEGLREDKPAAEIRRKVPHPKPAAQSTAVPSRRPRG